MPRRPRIAHQIYNRNVGESETITQKSRNLRRSNGSGKKKTKAACRARRRERKGPGRFTSSPSTSIAGRAMNLAAKPVRACSRASSVTGLMLHYETRINSLNKSWRNPWCRRQKFVVREKKKQRANVFNMDDKHRRIFADEDGKKRYDSADRNNLHTLPTPPFPVSARSHKTKTSWPP